MSRTIAKYLSLSLAVFSAAMPLLAQDADEAPQMSAAEIRAEKKEAALWYKDYADKKKSAGSALKRVKDERSADRAVKTIQELYGLSSQGVQTALGEVGEAKRPESAAIDEILTRNGKKTEKLNAVIEKESARIEEAGLMTPELEQCIEKALE